MKKDIIFHLFVDSMKMCKDPFIISKENYFQALVGNTFEMFVDATADDNTSWFIVRGQDRKGNYNGYITKSTVDGYECFAKLTDINIEENTWKKAVPITKNTFIKNFKKFYNDAKTHIRFCKEWNMNPWEYDPTIC